LGFKIGVEKFYTTIYAAYNPIDGFGLENFATGFGIGSIIPIGDRFFLNPELNSFSPLTMESSYDLLSFVPFFGYKLGEHFSVAVAPSVTWVHTFNDYPPPKPFFKIAEHYFEDDSITNKNSIVVGARAAVRFAF
jgi:hypothetical protein